MQGLQDAADMGLGFDKEWPAWFEEGLRAPPSLATGAEALLGKRKCTLYPLHEEPRDRAARPRAGQGSAPALPGSLQTLAKRSAPRKRGRQTEEASSSKKAKT